MNIKFGRDGKEMGDYQEIDVPALLKSNVLRHNDLFWHDGMATWALVESKWPTLPPVIQERTSAQVNAPSFGTKILSSLGSFFSSERQFSSYEECPEIYFRFNGRKEYGPHKLDRVVSYSGSTPGDVVEGRFADEKPWRPRKYFLKVWEHIPLSAHTTKRLTNEGIVFDSRTTEFSGRQLLKERQKLKTPTATQLKRLRELGIIAKAGSREVAKTIIAAEEKILRAKDEKAALKQQRIDDAPQIESFRERLSRLKERVNSISEDWTPKVLKDLDAISQYTDLVEEALDYAMGFDDASLAGGPFFDPKKSEDYYLEWEADLNEKELCAFQGSIFIGYLKTGGQEFDHVKPLREAFPSMKISRL